MALEDQDKVDAVGVEDDSGKVILSILDSWDWEVPHSHLLALQAKLNAYFSFVEDGQLHSSYPRSVGRGVVIDVITRFPLHPLGEKLLTLAAESCRDLGIEIRTRHLPGG